jgi:glycosyltransferase involved in cell wall biosynthesis
MLTVASDHVTQVGDADKLPALPLVSVLMITYNHAEYLAQAIEGVVSQQCDFPFELIIGEDASKDGTREIALEYQRRYPHLVRVIYSASNVGMNANGQRTLDAARGEFVAFCEGDDYWCATDKLARQVAQIASDPEIGVVHTDWVRARKRADGWQVGWRRPVHRWLPISLLEGELFSRFYCPKILRTCTILLRRSAVLACSNSGLKRREYRFGDTVLAAYVTSRWKVAYVPEVTAVYRESPFSVLRSGKKARLAFLRSCLEFDSDARAFFSARQDYPMAYRWEVSVGLLLWAISARDGATARFALRDLSAHYGAWTFLKGGWQAVSLRRVAWGHRHHVAHRPSAKKMRG